MNRLSRNQSGQFFVFVIFIFIICCFISPLYYQEQKNCSATKKSDPNKMVSTKRHHGVVSTGGNSKVAATPTTGMISKKNKTNNNKFKDDGKILLVVDTVSHAIVEFLSTPSLVAFSSCNKICMAAVQNEVTNRKKRIKELLGLAAGHGKCFIPTRANVIEAEQLCKEAKRIIYTDLDWQDRINSENWTNGDDEFDSSIDRFFEKERKLLESERDLRMLLMCFYLAPDGSEPLQQLEEDHIETARSSIGRILGAEDLFGGSHEYPEYYNDPFFKFNVPEIVDSHANNLASLSALLGALRAVARAQVYRAPYSRDCTRYLIHCADERRRKILEEGMILSFCSGNVSVMSG
jgi:hypothetical protein